jgi:hypothetical protein
VDGALIAGDQRLRDIYETRLLLARIYGCRPDLVDDVVAYAMKQIPPWE